jgi:hypothetical protein
MKRIIGLTGILLAAGLCSFGQYYPEVHVKGAVADGEIAVFDGVDGKYIRAGGTNSEAVLRTMTNFVAVASSSNWLVYYPSTRTLTGCVTNENTGPIGPQGTQGIQGIQGPAGSNGVNGVNGTNGVDGAPGTNGLAATITVAWVSNGVPGSSVIVTNVGDSNNALFGFVIPAGSNGVAGADGSNGVNGVNGTNGVDGAPGTNGADGLAATITVAWVSNGVPGSSVIVTNVGDSNNALFGFVIPAGGAVSAVQGTFPVFKLDVGLVDGNWTDFELKASTNNFTNMVYYVQSWTNVHTQWSDTNVWIYFTDDYSSDVRVWRQRTNSALCIRDNLVSTSSVVQWVYVYPSHSCSNLWSDWMYATNKNLIWSWVRADKLGQEMNATSTKQRWNPVRPDSWEVERTAP